VEGGGKERKKKSWKEYTATVDDIMAFIADRVYLRYNVVTGRVECKAPLVPPNWGDDTAQDISSPSGGRPGGGCWVPLNDRIVNSLWGAGETGEFVTSGYIMQAIGGNLSQKLSANKVGRAMTDLGFRRMRSHGERGYVVVAYSADEVKARKRIKACDAKPDEAGAVDTFDAIDTIF
jgi:hypothetical protein